MGWIDFASKMNRTAYIWMYSPVAVAYTHLSLEAAFETHLAAAHSLPGGPASTNNEASATNKLNASATFHADPVGNPYQLMVRSCSARVPRRHLDG